MKYEDLKDGEEDEIDVKLKERKNKIEEIVFSNFPGAKLMG